MLSGARGLGYYLGMTEDGVAVVEAACLLLGPPVPVYFFHCTENITAEMPHNIS